MALLSPPDAGPVWELASAALAAAVVSSDSLAGKEACPFPQLPRGFLLSCLLSTVVLKLQGPLRCTPKANCAQEVHVKKLARCIDY